MFKKTTPARESYRKGWLHGSIARLTEVLGTPTFHGKDFHDDDSRVDAYWIVRDGAGRYLHVWNYKNGPAYGEGPLEEIREWPAFFFEQKVFELAQQEIDAVCA